MKRIYVICLCIRHCFYAHIWNRDVTVRTLRNELLNSDLSFHVVSFIRRIENGIIIEVNIRQMMDLLRNSVENLRWDLKESMRESMKE